MAVIVLYHRGPHVLDATSDGTASNWSQEPGDFTEVTFIGRATDNSQPEAIEDLEPQKEPDDNLGDLNPDCKIHPPNLPPSDRERMRERNCRAILATWRDRRRMRRLARSTCG